MAKRPVRVVAGGFSGYIGRVDKYSNEGDAVIMFDYELYDFCGTCLSPWQYEYITEEEYFKEKLRGRALAT